MSVKEKNTIAEKMRSPRKYYNESYTKCFQIDPIQLIVKQEEPIINNSVMDETTQYERQKRRVLSYYHLKKGEILQKQKEYQHKQVTYENSRKRSLGFFNSLPDYENTMKDSTKTKHDF